MDPQSRGGGAKGQTGQNRWTDETDETTKSGNTTYGPATAEGGKCSAAITKDRAALDEVMQYFSGDVAEHLPATSPKKVDIVTKLAEVVLAEKAVVAAPDWEGSFADLIGKMNEAKTQLQTTMKSVKLYAEQAKIAIAELGP